MEINIPDLVLEKSCWKCNPASFKDGDSTCNFCDGSGWKITEDGYRVLEFLRHHWKPTVKEQP